MNNRKLLSLAGICTYEEAYRVGYSVDWNVELLKRYNYVKTRLVDIISKHMNRTPEWEVKGAFSLHIWLDAEHSQLIRKRVAEMREPPLQLDKVPTEELKAFLDEVLHSEDTLELLVGIYEVVRSNLLDALKRHQAETNPLVDQPTCRLLNLIISEEEKMLEWGRQAIAVLSENEEHSRLTADWRKHLEVFLAAAGGICGKEEQPASLPAARSVKPFELKLVPQRDERFTDIWNNVDYPDQVYKDEALDPKERTWALLFKRLREMDVPEMMCSIIAQTPGKPWEYYLDMCRQIWDEVRHSMMGEVAFEHKGVDWTKLPIRINWSYELNTLLTPLERHAILYDVEFGLMPGDTGKKFEFEVVKKSGYDLAVTFQDHDWADEVLHAQIGRKWFVKEMKNYQAALELAQQAYEKIATARPQYRIEHENWWNDFIQSVKHIPLADAEVPEPNCTQ
jgi:hypothetical protein